MNIRLAALVSPLVFLTGCASIVNGQNQSVSVETRADSGPVVGASCKLSNNKGTWFVTTPGSAIVNRSYEDLSVRCDKDSAEPGLASVKSSTKAMAFGNILFGGIIGAGVDMSTGAAYDYPTLITVQMGKSIVLAPAPAQAEAGQRVAPPGYATSQPPAPVKPAEPAPAPAAPAPAAPAPAAPAPAAPASGAAN